MTRHTHFSKHNRQLVADVVAKFILVRWHANGIKTFYLDPDGNPVPILRPHPTKTGERISLARYPLIQSLIHGAVYTCIINDIPMPTLSQRGNPLRFDETGKVVELGSV